MRIEEKYNCPFSPKYTAVGKMLLFNEFACILKLTGLKEH